MRDGTASDRTPSTPSPGALSPPAGTELDRRHLRPMQTASPHEKRAAPRIGRRRVSGAGRVAGGSGSGVGGQFARASASARRIW